MPRLMCIPPNVTQIISAVPVHGTNLTIINNRWIVSPQTVLQDCAPICSHAIDLVPNPERFLPSEIEAIHHTIDVICCAMARLGQVNHGMEMAYELGMLHQIDAVNETIRYCRKERNLGCHDLVLAVDYLYGHVRTPDVGGEQ